MLRSQPDGSRAVRAAALSCLSGLCCFFTAELAAHAREASAAAPQLTWEAPASCPNREAVASRLQDTLGNELSSFGQSWQVLGQVHATADGQWRLVLELREPAQPSTAAARQRVLHARSCADLVEAAAVAVAIALGDAREVEAAAASAAPVTATSSPSLPSEPSARAPGLDVAASETAPLERAALARSLNVSLEALLDTASVSGFALGGSVALGGWLGDFGLAAHGVWLPAREAQIASGQSAEFSLLAAGARGCFRFWGNAQGLGLAACAGMELGSFAAESRGLLQAGSVRDTWLAPSLGLDARGSLLAHLAARSRLELLAPLRRQTYRVDLVEPVHEIPALTVRWSIGFDADLALP